MSAADALIRLRAGLDRDEAIARAAAERAEEWRSDGKGVAGGPFIPADPEWGMAECGEYVIVYDEGYPTEPESIHIAEFDPARVLRQVAAIRRAIDEELENQRKFDAEFGCVHDVEDIAAGRCPAFNSPLLEALADIYPTETGDPA